MIDNIYNKDGNNDLDYFSNVYNSFMNDYKMYNKMIGKINDLEKKYNVEDGNTNITLDDLNDYFDNSDVQDYDYIMKSLLDLLILDFCRLDDLINKQGYPSDFNLKKYLETIDATWFIHVYKGFMDTDIYENFNQKLRLYRNKRIAHIATDFDYKKNKVIDDEVFEFMSELYRHINDLGSLVSFYDTSHRLKTGELNFNGIRISLN